MLQDDGGAGGNHSDGTVALTRVRGEFGVVARRRVAPGEPLLTVEGELRDSPSKYSVQIGAGRHIEPGRNGGPEEVAERKLWPYLNHSCSPNAYLRGVEIVALREIAPGEQVTFNYNTTEYDMSSPFQCHCGAAGCQGSIAGFSRLDESAREGLRPLLSEYLRKLLNNGAPSSSS
jgi:hypothetical protein